MTPSFFARLVAQSSLCPLPLDRLVTFSELLGLDDRFPRLSVGKLFPPQAQDSASESLSGDPHLGREGVSPLFERGSAVGPSPKSAPLSETALSPPDWGVRGVVCDKATVLARPQVLVGGVGNKRGEFPARHRPRYSTRGRPAAAAAAAATRSRHPRHGLRLTARPARHQGRKVLETQGRRNGWEARAGGALPAPPPRL